MERISVHREKALRGRRASQVYRIALIATSRDVSHSSRQLAAFSISSCGSTRRYRAQHPYTPPADGRRERDCSRFWLQSCPRSTGPLCPAPTRGVGTVPPSVPGQTALQNAHHRLEYRLEGASCRLIAASRRSAARPRGRSSQHLQCAAVTNRRV